jgi:hypothetical protein
MKPIQNRFIPAKGFSAMMLFSFLFTRDASMVTMRTVRHERIHVRQMWEVNILVALLVVPLCTFTSLSWWWLLLPPGAFYLIYFICWIAEIMLPPYDRAYSNICFETEVYYNVDDLDYLEKRKPFAFLRYISNKKYPKI